MEKINVEELRELFIEIKYGNNIAFEKLYKNYKNLVYKIAYSILKNSHDSEDIVQIVFEKIYSIDKDKLPTNYESSWLYSVTKNETINYLKKKKNYIELEDIYEIEDDNNEINKLINQDSYNRLISKLNDNEKEIISLKILSNLSFEEIGKVLNKPTGTIKWRYYKSVNTLKLLLSNLGMFIISFISSCFVMKNEKKTSPQFKEDESVEIKDEIMEDKEFSREDENVITDDKNSQTQDSIVVGMPNVSNNYLGMSLMGISAIFLILTIFFSIIFTKHQLKRKKKLSKK